MLNSEETKKKIFTMLSKNEYYVKDKLSIIDELMLQMETLQR